MREHISTLFKRVQSSPVMTTWGSQSPCCEDTQVVLRGGPHGKELRRPADSQGDRGWQLAYDFIRDPKPASLLLNS